MREERTGQLLAAWSADIDTCLRDVIGTGRRVALVNFPNHANAGDPALWLGELAALGRLDAEVVYQSSWSAYDAGRLRRALGDDGGMVLLHGGANFGDLYPANQAATRERVLTELADLPIVQLPQSMHFVDPANRDRMGELLQAHGDVTLLAREHDSLARMRAAFGSRSEVCPDMALALPRRARARSPEVDVLWLARADPEARGYDVPDASDLSVTVLDWLDRVPDEPAWPLTIRLAHRLNRALLTRPALAQRLWRLDAATYRPLAEAWVDRGCEILARGRVVVTDRLHGHVLALLQGIPHVVLDNSYGKVRAVHDGWTRHSALVHWADGPDEALETARRLVGEAS